MMLVTVLLLSALLVSDVAANGDQNGAFENMELETENNLNQDLEKREFMKNFCADGKQWNHYCYQLFNDAKTWQDAEEYCKSVVPGGHLVSIRSQEHNDFIKNMLSAAIWIGFNDIDKEGKFIWTDESSTEFVNWNGGEPNNAGEEDCAELQQSGGWNDLQCSNVKLAFVCQSKRCFI
ncbi:C-type lectin-like isoform X1 [Heterodontus francisci]|uniref:C-type lectin-like isoform X1 n=2 Tax=Heterodontus francisci TaxID=7792 RepID=UPI00355BC480